VTPAVKVCGLTRRNDAEIATKAGAAYLGVVLAPGGKRTVAVEEARRFLEGLPARRVGVFVDADLDQLRHAAVELELHALQLHGEEPPELLEALRAAGPWELWKAVRVRGAADFRAAVERYGAHADALLLDGWSPAAYGGTGTRFPWDEIAVHRNLLPPGVSLIVAGGLRAENVADAVRLLRPHVVDVSSGVEDAPGIKNDDEVYRFLAAVRGPDSGT
jgi:phosphoribosylanthranilate isomerase